MVSYVNSDLSTHSYGLKFVSIGIILIFLLISTALIYNKNYGLDNIGLAISQSPHHEDKSVNVINPDKTTLSSYNDTKTKEINSNLPSNTSTTSNGKLVILTFGDTIKNQLTTAKPILDKYGFKASFFITCGFVDDSNRNEDTKNINNDNGKHRMSWNDILQLQQDGQDIESKGMTHQRPQPISSKRFRI